jgi:3-dehydroquinate synthase
MAADLSHRLGFIDIDTRNRITALTCAADLPTVAPALGVDRFIELMRVDKKAEAGEITFLLLRKLGQAFVTTVPDADLRATLLHAVLRPPTEAPVA